MLKITELGFCLAFAWLFPGLSHRAGTHSSVPKTLDRSVTAEIGFSVDLDLHEKLSQRIGYGAKTL
jgi:hypothetical protein